ncbi:MAG: permease-like cell division protein FtsX [Paludibacteraceae bacterium]|jgi:cell division transport system permease protein|nr:permease-like cell division protein FtsX [Paludibacteraceae bacterium]OQA48588.1 MAG: Cell division protein FtsX [Bacteroidetes bacterium ADurb.Bin302]
MNKSKINANHLFNSRITSIISISLVIFLIGVTTALLLMAGELSVLVRENLTLSVVLKDNVKDADVQKLLKTLDASEYSKSTEYIDKEAASKELAEELGQDPVEFLGYNPLLASVEMKLHSEYANNDSIARIETELRRMPEVKEVIYQKNLIEAVNDNVKRVSAVLSVFSILLLLISYALISNTVRLSVYAKRFLIHTMKLVGATSSFIRRPFLLQGAITGILSAVIAMGMLSAILFWAQSEISTLLTTEMLNTLLVSFFVMILSGVVITIIATYLSVSRYLRLTIDDMYYI